MADTKTSAETAASALSGAELIRGVQSGGNVKITATQLSTFIIGAGSVSVASGKTLTVSNTLTLAGTDSTMMTFPGTSATLARTDAGNTFTGHQTIEGVTSTGATGTGNLVFASSPTLTTAALGSSTATTQTAGDISTKVATTAFVAAALPPVLRSYIAGLTLSNDGGTPHSVLDVAAGQCADSTNAVYISLGAFTKSTGGSWTSGTGNNGIGGGLTIAASTWYHVFAIINGGAADIYFDTSVTAANKPASTTAFRRIGSFLTDGSANILAFTQVANEFYWTAPVADVAITTFSATRTTLTLSIPLGVKCRVIARASHTANAVAFVFSGPDEPDVAPNNSAGAANAMDLDGNINGPQRFPTTIYSNTSSQINYRATATSGGTMALTTLGWIDDRGSFN
jgi:hypothetical protein